MNLADVRAAVAKLPWVERAEARKHWPDAIELVVYEQQPFAHWGKDRLINRRGQVFSVAGVEGLQGLPELSGPDDRLDDVIQFHADCVKEFTGSGLIVTAVALSPRGGWTLTLASGASIAVGREEPREPTEAISRCVADARGRAHRCARVCGFALCEWLRCAVGRCAACRTGGAEAGIRNSGFGISETRRQTDPVASVIPNPESRIPAFPS